MEYRESTTKATVRAKGQITLPQAVRAALRIEEDDQVEFHVDAHGDVTIRGLKSVATDQAWFWMPEWQEGEREASDQIKNGLTAQFDSDEEFLKTLGG